MQLWKNIAKYMYVFPIVGIAIGLLVGSFGFGLSFFLDPLLVSLLVVASIAIVTGIHHADGLADFADGLMVKGTKRKKIQAMKDLSTGSGWNSWTCFVSGWSDNHHISY